LVTYVYSFANGCCLTEVRGYYNKILNLEILNLETILEINKF